MNSIAIVFGNVTIYWQQIITLLGILSGFSLTYSLYVSKGRSARPLWVFLPIAVIGSVFLGRIFHFITHKEQYNGGGSSFWDFGTGGYVLIGVFIAIVIATVVANFFSEDGNLRELFDFIVPGFAVAMIFVRFSALFDTSYRGNIVIENKLFQGLPFGAAVTTASGATEYRLATFFIEAMFLMVLVAFILIMHYRKYLGTRAGKRYEDGHIARTFLVVYCAGLAVLDSNRYDASYFSANGFVSITQIVAMVLILLVLLFYTIKAKKSGAVTKRIVAIWILYLVTLAVAVLSEFLSQRFTNMYMLTYPLMILALVVMALSVNFMHTNIKRKRRGPRKVNSIYQDL